MTFADYLPCCWTTPADFPRFKQLPAELRLMIWREALPDPRTIQIVKRQIFRVRNVPVALSPSSSDNDHSFPSGTGAVIWYDKSLPQRNCISLQESYCTSTINCPSDLMALLGACRESRLETLCRYKPIFIPRMPKSSFFPLHYFDPLVDSIFIEDIWPWARGQYSKPAALFETRRLSISCNGWSQRWNSSRSQRAKFLGKNGLLRFKHLEELNIVWRVLNHEEERKYYSTALVDIWDLGI
ncbi:hypothetical protein B0O99DRAFT_590136 [Bisporella sp. PMI_857]|nr:hypothetical protein B0O99DRAFT_590748 [Bisporella sp. PMI_857]KAH8600471.1 hypothetical protein B0O99DRAFT_590136 [Bisporella sp. PMI_857]